MQHILLSIFWIIFAGIFAIYINVSMGSKSCIEFLSGYIIEKALSIDNIIVFMMIFKTHQTPLRLQKKILTLGIVSAIIFRGIMIYIGSVVLEKFSILFRIAGVYLIWNAINLLSKKRSNVSINIPSDKVYSKSFLSSQKGHILSYTGAVLVMVEIVDLIFALDSVPAVFAITSDPMIVYTSNIFAVLGMRSIFFVIQSAIKNTEKLTQSIGLLLLFIGFKMIFDIHINPYMSIAIIIAIMLRGVI